MEVVEEDGLPTVALDKIGESDDPVEGTPLSAVLGPRRTAWVDSKMDTGKFGNTGYAPENRDTDTDTDYKPEVSEKESKKKEENLVSTEEYTVKVNVTNGVITGAEIIDKPLKGRVAEAAAKLQAEQEAEAARLAAEKEAQDRIEQERIEQERIAAILEQERIAARLEQERIERERNAAARLQKKRKTPAPSQEREKKGRTEGGKRSKKKKNNKKKRQKKKTKKNRRRGK